MKPTKYLLPLCTFLIVGFSFGIVKQSHANGGLSLSQTRVVFDGKMKSSKITINNNSERVYLINSRVLKTPSDQEKGAETLPFMATPPLFRLEKNSQNTVLISRQNTSSLPTDRESVFYLSFLAIPSIQKNSAASEEDMTTTQVSLGLRMLIKLFYRPSDLSLPVSAAPEKLRFSQQGKQLFVENPTPYYLTFAQLKLDEHTINVREQGAMIAPFSSQTYHVQTPVKTIYWNVINDYGGISETFQWKP